MYDTLKYSTVKYVLAPVQTADVEERAVRSFLAFAKALAAKEDSKLNVQIVRVPSPHSCHPRCTTNARHHKHTHAHTRTALQVRYGG
jgi:hypothetical protein